MKKNFVWMIFLVGLLAFSSCKKDIPGFFENMGEIEQLFPIAVNEKIGYIDKEGEIVINPLYYKDGELYEFFFINGLTPVSTDDEKYGFINKSGEIEITPMFDWANSFSKDGLALVNNGDSYYFINKKGNPEIMLNQYDDFSCYFWDGMAWVEDEQGDYGFIDTDGNSAIPAIYYDVHRFSEDLAWVKMNDDDDYMAIDKDGKSVTPDMFGSTRPFSEGLAAVKVGGYWGFVDTKGEYVISPQYDWCGSFYEGLAIVELNNKEGFINKDGEWEIMAQFDYCYEFSNGLAAVEMNDKCGFINKKGEWVIQPIYNEALYFMGDLGMVQIDDDDEFISWINKDGEIIWKDNSGKSASLKEGTSTFWKKTKNMDRGELRYQLRQQLGF
ncbi:MAG: WG repeat-containing protein [Prolixibacteraceae bacterium]|nr:WG repeat-containing protein [Prolixibacteraceae bacterium]